MTDIKKIEFSKQKSLHAADPQGFSNTPDILGEIKSEVAGEATPLLNFVVTHIKAIVAIIVLLIAVIAGYGTWQWKKEQTAREAQLQLGRVLLMEDPKARLSSLENLLKDAPASSRLGILAEIASLAAQSDAIAKAADAYSRLYEQDPKGSIGLFAAINAADLFLRLHQPAQALAILQKIEPEVPEALKISIQMEIASALERSGNIKGAIARYEAISKHESVVANESASDYCRFKIAMLEKELGAK